MARKLFCGDLQSRDGQDDFLLWPGKLMADSPYESSFSKLTAYSAALKQPVTIPEKLDGNTSFVLRSADADELDKFLATLTNENPKTVEFGEI